DYYCWLHYSGAWIF
nr:immunoglobulin light chain junction region [Macaca mulatta]MOY05274.1 immunoglobulin light chain junction region [Macaca mulatta]MOY05475.1 immunoglobulin light chain junction region [Macaca mulatta]MOY05592.1 immunoglobulin light chain junction region [Macaca mulatta]MOY06697.1 immunoglobulin light chain junction region [Macaca mulatta]